MAKVEYLIQGKNHLSKVLQTIDKDADRTEGKINNIGKGGVGGGSGGGKGMMGSIVGGNLLASGIAKATGALVDFGKESFQAFGKYEQFGVALTTMFHGNKQEAKNLQEELVGFAKTTPFELTEIQDATKQLIAYGSTSGGVGKELRMLGDISSGVGAPIGEIAYLYGTARTQGRLFARDIYQLSGRGIPIVAALAKQFKVSESAVMGLVEKGKVGFPQMQKAMESMTAAGGQFAGMMDAQSKTVLGKWSNMQDAIDQLKVGIGNSQSGLIHAALDFGISFVSSLSDSIKYTNDLNEKLSRLGVKLKFGENIDALKGRDLSGNLNAQSLNRIDLANKSANQTVSLESEYLKRISGEKDAKNLIAESLKNVDRFFNKENERALNGRNQMNAYNPTGRAGNDTEFIRLVSINEDARNKLKELSRSLLEPKKKVDGMPDESSRMGSGTTVETQAPKNMYITINGGLANWKIDKIEGTENDVRNFGEKVEMKLLEILNDAYLAQR